MAAVPVCVWPEKDSNLAEFRRSLWELKGPFLFLSPEERQELIRLLKQYLRRKGVLLLENTQVTDLELENGNDNGSGTGLAVKKLYVKRRLQEEETDREAFVFEKIDLRSGDVCIMDNGSGSGKLWKRQLTCILLWENRKPLWAKKINFSPFGLIILQTGLKQFQLEAEILALWEHFHGWKKAAALQETMLWQVPEVQWMS